MGDPSWTPRVYSVEECEAVAARVLNFGAPRTVVHGEGRRPVELVDFLRARLDEDEEIAREAGERSMEWRLVTPLDDAELGDAWWLNPPEKYHAERHDPARILAEVEAKRALIAQGGPFCTSNCDDPDNEPMDPDTNWTTPLEHHLDCGAHEAAKLFVRPFRAHPDFDPAWLED